MPGHEADEDCKCFNCHAKKFPKANERTPPYRLRGEKYLGAKKQPEELTPELFYSLPLGKQVWLRQKFRWLTQDIPENPSGNRGQSSTRSRSRHAKWQTVSRRKGTINSA